MNYELVYRQLITKGLERGLDKKKLDFYTERHHIIPRCMKGSDDDSNIVLLTAREHYIAHKLLIYIYPNNKNLVLAMKWFESPRKDGTKVVITSRDFEKYRKLQSSIMGSWNKGRPAWNKGKPSPYKGVPRSKDTVEKWRKTQTGQKRSKESSKNIASAQRKAPHWKLEKELYNEWLLSNMIGCCRFRKIVVAKGYPDVQYQKMVNKWKSGDIPSF